MTRDDCSLDTQTAAPPLIPPRRPLVGVAMADHDELRSRLQAMMRQLERSREQIDDALARIAHIRRHNLNPPPDA